MGLYDRDYAHTRRTGIGGGFGGAMGVRPAGGMWSANAWIIAICIGVFMIDALVGARFTVDAGTVIDSSVPQEVIDRAQLRNNPMTSTLPGATAYPLIDDQTGQIVGQKREFTMPPLQAIGHFSTGRGFLQLEVWRLIGFQFLHANMSHLFMNMLGLFFFGPIVESRLGRRKYVAFYLICGIAGALMYLALNGLGLAGLRLPGVLIADQYTPLIGASAGVFGVLMASAYLAPKSTVLLFFVIPAPLKAVVYGFVALAAFNLFAGGNNAGGDAAHLGGAIAGAFFVRKPELLREFLDFSGAEASKRRNARATKRAARPASARRAGPSDEEVDRILAKVANHGLPSLTEKERKTLEKASKSKRG